MEDTEGLPGRQVYLRGNRYSDLLTRHFDKESWEEMAAFELNAGTAGIVHLLRPGTIDNDINPTGYGYRKTGYLYYVMSNLRPHENFYRKGYQIGQVAIDWNVPVDLIFGLAIEWGFLHPDWEE